MEKITIKQAIEELTKAKKIYKAYLSERISNELVEEIVIKNEKNILDNMQVAEIIKNSNSIVSNKSYLYFHDINEVYEIVFENFKTLVVITDINKIIYNII